MDYQSTRSGGLTASAPEAILRGIAPDGGLYVCPDLPGLRFDWRGCLEQDTLGMAARLLAAQLPGCGDMAALTRESYAGKFETPELTPLAKVGELYALELYRGPTSAFKDVALSVLPRLVTAARRATGSADEIAVLTATSGDTGKAALEGFRDVEGTRILVFYPDQGVSAVQKAQMVTQEGRNVCVCAVRGNFDDCQTGVKDAFAALSGGVLPAGTRLSSANSINIGRLAPQVTYYFAAYAALLRQGALKNGEPVDFAVPTGNFGDILAGYFARLLGLPVGRLICASNANRVLTDFFETGVYDRRRPFYKTASPSMDILVSSNLERLLFLASGGDTMLVSDCMARLRVDGRYELGGETMENIRALFSAGSCTDAEAAAVIGRLWRERRYLCDPHTAVAFAVAESVGREGNRPLAVLSTASPFKFPAFVLRAIGGTPCGDEFADMEALRDATGVPIPANLAGLRERPARHRDVIDRRDILAYVRRKLNEKEW